MIDISDCLDFPDERRCSVNKPEWGIKFKKRVTGVEFECLFIELTSYGMTCERVKQLLEGLYEMVLDEDKPDGDLDSVDATG